MKRTTSFSELSPPLPACSPPPCQPSSDDKGSDVIKSLLDRIRRNSIDLSSLNLTNAAHFLNTCGFCKRRIGPGIETFIYRVYQILLNLDLSNVWGNGERL
ncbi:uncharacterized protein LOC110037124 [Phalaenopsis equestris]|uniref:uncharacterized protein LOC110035167 n=1 Tax=Phalaenopsis equestris TaxID=78828 RepID=UPI0009E1DBBA|nr:uncharacterized protein LOC110035167 [Phalaenopsis equestris]XP_020597365.1 uncharacterized protein LOC110037124 [Phalaenopsis equestris]